MSAVDPEPASDEVLEIRTGTRVPYTMVGDWVLLSTLSPHAKLLYTLLAAHINVSSGQRRVWPSLDTLAEWMGLKQARSVSKYIDELVAFGAIVKTQNRTSDNLRTRNSYDVNGEAPAGLATHSRFADFYRERNEKRRAISAGHGVVRCGALRADQGKQETAGEPVVRHSAPRPAPEHPDVLRPSAPEQDQQLQQDEEETTTPSTTAAPPREDVELLCNRLAQRMIENGCKPPEIGKRWRDAARLLLDRDGRDLEKALNLIDWATSDSFWATNVLSMPTFRAKYEALRLRAIKEFNAKNSQPVRRSQTAAAMDSVHAAFAQYRANKAASKTPELPVGASR